MEFIANLFWLTDVIFLIGMGLALNSEMLSNFTAFLCYWVIKIVNNKPNIPQHYVRQVEKNKNKFAYHIIRAVLSVAFAGNMIYHGYAAYKSGRGEVSPGRRNMILNFLYIVYPLLTIHVSAHDILLHDDRKKWSPGVKARHVFFPLKFDDNKVFKNDLNTRSNSYIQQIKQITDGVTSTLIDFGRFSSSYYVLHAIVPWTRLFLPPFALFVHSKLNLLLNNVFDLFTMKAFKNRYEHYFGNLWKIYDPSGSGDKHDQLGRQYQYFNYSFKPLERVLKKQIFDVMRKKKFTVKESKAVTIMTRGVLVTTALLSFSMLRMDFDLVDSESTMKQALVSVSRPLLYYGIHATYAYYQPIPSKKTKLPIVRTVLAAGESVMAGYLFYQPIIEKCLPVVY